MVEGARLLPVVRRREPAPDHVELTFPVTAGIADSVPGQFVNLLCRATAVSDPLLRRPLSIYSVESDTFSVLFRVVGRGTSRLAAVKVGDEVDVLGPLGRGFHIDESSATSGRSLLIGGGVGTPPMFYLSQRLHDANVPFHVIVGFGNKAQIVGVDRWQRMGVTPTVTTDDGSAGVRGMVTTPLEEALADGDVAAVYACGPRPMLQAVVEACQRAGVPSQIAMEEWMGCGVGVCLSCVQKVKTASPDDGTSQWARICVEGPVFRGDEVVWT